jgi:hypothetical protein
MKKALIILMLFLSYPILFVGAQQTGSYPDTVRIPWNPDLPKDDSLRKEIIGKWKDQNSTLSFFRNNSYIVVFDTGERQEGFWEIKDRVLKFEVNSPFRDLIKYLIVDFVDNRMVYTYPDDKSVWVAERVSTKN